jgi:hypothetical protein
MEVEIIFQSADDYCVRRFKHVECCMIEANAIDWYQWTSHKTHATNQWFVARHSAVRGAPLSGCRACRRSVLV